MSRTKLNKLVIEKFRALNNVEVEFGDHITVVCGKNGTSKSSILGIAAQIFSFEKDYTKQDYKKDRPFAYRQVTGKPFKSQYSEHFRISEKFDLPGTMEVNIELQDGYTEQTATATLQLDKRSNKSEKTVLPRPVVRKNSTALSSNYASRNFTHPVIFLSLKRLYPIADRDYKIIDFEYLKKHEQEFIGLANELLNRQSSQVTGTGGTIGSAVAHGKNYDQESVSAGEDNAGQIILALMSFRKLQEEYLDYKGGLLLIDEADAGLFPTAQINLLKILDRECRRLNLQVVMTSHSPTLIEYAYEKSLEPHQKKYKTIYLSNTYGGVEVKKDWSWAQISADINTRTVSAGVDEKLPKINVYFEDKEAADFFAALMNRQPIKKFTAPLPEVTLGCNNYLQLIDKGIAEFSEKSIVCLDADAAQKVGRKNLKTVVFLPGELPPDQLIFEHLYNLPADDAFWNNDLQFTRDVLTNSAAEVIREFGISGSSVDVRARVAAYQGTKTPREIFKQFYKDDEFQKLVVLASKPYNPWKHWIENNQMACGEFLKKFELALRGVMSSGYAVDVNKLTALKVKLKGS